MHVYYISLTQAEMFYDSCIMYLDGLLQTRLSIILAVVISTVSQ